MVITGIKGNNKLEILSFSRNISDNEGLGYMTISLDDTKSRGIFAFFEPINKKQSITETKLY